MDTDMTIGCVLVAGALSLIAYLTLWSRRRIDWIADQKTTPSAREILKRTNGER